MSYLRGFGLTQPRCDAVMCPMIMRVCPSGQHVVSDGTCCGSKCAPGGEIKPPGGDHPPFINQIPSDFSTWWAEKRSYAIGAAVGAGIIIALRMSGVFK